MFSSDDSGLPDNGGGTGDASIGSDIGSVAAPVPVVDLLGEDVDITPARHLPSDSVARVSLDLLTRHPSSLQTLLAELPTSAARPPTGPSPRRSRPTGVVPRGTGPERNALHPQNRTQGCH